MLGFLVELSLIALLLLLESAIIKSTFALQYRVSIFWTVALVVVSFQVLLDITLGRLIPPRRGRERFRDALGLRRSPISATGDLRRQQRAHGSPELFNDVFAPFLTVEAVAGKVVADIGAGTGRFVNILLGGGARQVTAVEPSDAIDVLRRNIPPQAEARVDVIHATGDRLPGTDHFDYVFSIGVLHHIPEPGPVCRASLRALRPGGVMAIWLYGREGNAAYLAIFGPMRALTRRLPHRLLAGLVWIMGWGLDAPSPPRPFCPCRFVATRAACSPPHALAAPRHLDQLNPACANASPGRS